MRTLLKKVLPWVALSVVLTHCGGSPAGNSTAGLPVYGNWAVGLNAQDDNGTPVQGVYKLSVQPGTVTLTETCTLQGSQPVTVTGTSQATVTAGQWVLTSALSGSS